MQAFDRLALGVTVTYTRGHAMAVAETTGAIRHDEPKAESARRLLPAATAS